MKRTARHAPGSVVFDHRRGQWQYFWYDSGHRRSRVIGDRRKYPTKAAAWQAIEADHFHKAANPEAGPTVRNVVKGYLRERASKRHSTRLGVRSRLRNWVLPRWGGRGLLSALQPRPVQLWLDSLGEVLSPKSRGHIHDVLRQLWNFAMYAGWVPVTPNPMSLVVVKGRSKRKRKPRSLTVEQFRAFLEQLADTPIIRLIAIVCASLGLRISEALALRWRNLDVLQKQLMVERGIVRQVEDEVKTESSERPMPVDAALIEVFTAWKRQSEFSAPDNFIFASPFQLGRLPVSYPGVWRIFQQAADRAGIGRFGTHTLRHSYRSWLDAIGTPIAVQQKLMRHTDIRTTLSYGDVVTLQESEALAQISALTLGKQHAIARRSN